MTVIPTTATDANGLYTFSNLPAGKTWTVVPSKTESVVSGISPMDAVLIMQQMKKTILSEPALRYSPQAS
jgi:hypothetical protein